MCELVVKVFHQSFRVLNKYYLDITGKFLESTVAAIRNLRFQEKILVFPLVNMLIANLLR